MTTDTLNLIPQPLELHRRDGCFRLAPTASIVVTGNSPEPATDVAELLGEYLHPATGFALPVRRGQPATGDLVLSQTGNPAPDDAGFLPEAYALDVTATGVRIEAESAAGLARAIQTLRQLFDPAIFTGSVQKTAWELPCVAIKDQPRFRWRGLHLDVSRYFFTPDEVCRFIELQALHRYNMCHLHLTDDQGWRVQIRKYPKLTEIGGWRSGTIIGHSRQRPIRYDDVPHSGFYTQDDIRRIVAFAARRHVTVVPEIDMPGHMQAAIASYPELGNLPYRPEVLCGWGICSHILNVEEATVNFMKDVLDEVMELFPSRFIHIGGDEAVKHEWASSRRAQERMAELGLSSEEELQSWFIRQMDTHIAAAGRRCLGWDEILEGGLAPGAAVMSWRDEKGGIAAAQSGHDVVMAPNQWTYFDYYQSEPIAEEPVAIGGMLPTDRVYAYEPIPAALTEEQASHVLGGQGQLWSEYLPTFRLVEYMAYPRACALAEVLWLPRARMKYADFYRRLAAHRARLDTLGINAHPRP